MIADWTVEVSSLSPSIDVPWDGYVDLHWGPTSATCPVWNEAAAKQLAEVQAFPELLMPLHLANRLNSSTSKVDVFPIAASEVDPEISEMGEEGSRYGLGSYLDVFTVRSDVFNRFERFTELASRAVKALTKLDLPASCAEIVVRPAAIAEQQTFGWTLYTMGFGPDEQAARAAWAKALQSVTCVFGLQTSNMIVEDLVARFPHLDPALQVAPNNPGE